MYKQKINKLLIGTNNKGKLREIKSLLPKSIKIYATSVFNLRSPVENGKTFKENSLIKSKYFSKKTGLFCLADDSGLEIDLLDKDPGIYSARWAGRYGDFNKAIKKVYRELNKKNTYAHLDNKVYQNKDLVMIEEIIENIKTNNISEEQKAPLITKNTNITKQKKVNSTYLLARMEKVKFFRNYFLNN